MLKILKSFRIFVFLYLICGLKLWVKHYTLYFNFPVSENTTMARLVLLTMCLTIPLCNLYHQDFLICPSSLLATLIQVLPEYGPYPFVIVLRFV